MKVRRLEMKSFRGFRELSLEFTGQVTVLVGINGAGKTSILDCLAVLLSQMAAARFEHKGFSRRLYETDILLSEPHTLNTIDVTLAEQGFRWSLALVRKGLPRQVASDLTGLKALDSQTRAGLYELDPFSAYFGALEGTGRDFKAFFEWFREREDLENEQRLQIDSSRRDRQLEAVRAAIEKLVPGFSGLRVQRAPLRMVVQKEGLPLELDQLSDGEKGLLALAGDLVDCPRNLST